MKNKNSKLFHPFKIKGMELKNRVVMAPMHTKFASESGEVTDRMISYLVERAKGGAGLIILENTCIDWKYGRAAGNPVTLHDDLNRSGLSNIALAVHRYNTKIVSQLHHTGRQNLRSNIDGREAPVAPSVVKSKIGGDEPRALTEEEIELIIQQYVDAARRTKDAGFDGVELHGAHGYLLTQFYSPYTNRREDKWGGSRRNRARFPYEVVRRIRAEVGEEFPIFYRLSAEERIEGGTTLEDTIYLVKLLEEAGVDCFDISAGIYDSIEWIYTLQGVAPGSLISLAEAVRKNTTKPVVGVSRLGWDLKFAEKVLDEDKVDLVAIGRSFLADSHLIQKYYEGKEEDIIPCIACNECVAMENKGWQLHCVVNPLLASEYLQPVQKSQSPKQVVVIGSGPAGMQCAITASQCGHKVTIIEETNNLGGQLIAASTPRYKSKEIGSLLKYFETQVKKNKVKVLLNTQLDSKILATLKPDVAIIAVGARPNISGFTGTENVVSAYKVLHEKKSNLGKKIAIIGSSGVGIDVALYLKENNEDREIIVLEKSDEIGGDLNEFLKRHTTDMAEKQKIKFLTGCEVTDIKPNKVIASTYLGLQEISCDAVVAACGFKVNRVDEIERLLNDKNIPFTKIGSAVKAGTIFEATQGGFWAAVDI